METRLTPFVAMLMGPDSDLTVMEAAADVLSQFDVAHEIRVTSVHRTPEDVRSYVTEAESRGCQVYIADAGMAAQLAGMVAATTIRPVIGVPIDTGPLNGLDALLSTVQMPGGIPVATVAIGKTGAENAAYLALQMMSLADDGLQEQLLQDRADNVERVRKKSASLGK